MTSPINMTPEELIDASEVANDWAHIVDSVEQIRWRVAAKVELLARLREREAAMQIVEHWKFSPAADWSAETQSFAASVLLSAMQVARRGES